MAEIVFLLAQNIRFTRIMVQYTDVPVELAILHTECTALLMMPHIKVHQEIAIL
jgi:hypothetical protein